MRTIGQALTLLAVVASACFAAQAALPLPGRGSLIAAQALKQLSPRRVLPVHHSTNGTVTVSARCASHHLVSRPGAVGIFRRPPQTWIEGRRDPMSTGIRAQAPHLTFRFPSCPRALRAWVGAELERASPVAITNVRYAGTPTYRLTFLTDPPLVIYVDRETLGLVAVNVPRRRQTRLLGFDT
jgi:hypothetical protein